MSELIGLVGLLVLCVAGWLVFPVAGVFAAGVSLLFVAHRLQKGGR